MIMKRKLTEKLTENVFIRIDIQNDFHSTYSTLPLMVKTL